MCQYYLVTFIKHISECEKSDVLPSPSRKGQNYRMMVIVMSPNVVKICELFTFPYTTTDIPGAAFTLGAGEAGDGIDSAFLSAVIGVSAFEASEGVLSLGVVLPK